MGPSYIIAKLMTYFAKLKIYNEDEMDNVLGIFFKMMELAS